MAESPITSGFINPQRAIALGLQLSADTPVSSDASVSTAVSSPTSKPSPRPRSRSRSRKKRSRSRSRDRKRRSRTRSRDRKRRSSDRKERSKKESRSRSRKKDVKDKKSHRSSKSRSKSHKRSEKKKSRSRSRSDKKDKKKKASMWDLPPADLAAQQLQQMSASLSPWTTSNVSPQNIQSMQAQALHGMVMASNVVSGQGSMGAGQLTKKARTIYVGNLAPSLTEGDLRDFFNREVIKVVGRPATYVLAQTLVILIIFQKLIHFQESSLRLSFNALLYF